MDQRIALITLAELLAAHQCVTHFAISMRALGKGDFFKKLKGGGDCRTATAYQIRIRSRNAVDWGLQGEIAALTTSAEAPAGDPDQVLLWTASGYDGPALTGNQPTITGNVMSFAAGGGLSNTDTPLSGVYMCFAVQWPTFPGAEALVAYVNNAPGNIFADGDYIAMRAFGSNTFGVDIWQGPTETSAQFTVSDPSEWHVVEAWAFGSTIGVSVNGSADQTATLETALTTTSGIKIFGTENAEFALDGVYGQIRSAMPDATQRAAFRAAAQALIPT